jgi:hypothetical protein
MEACPIEVDSGIRVFNVECTPAITRSSASSSASLKKNEDKIDYGVYNIYTPSKVCASASYFD